VSTLPSTPAREAGHALCVDFGSTFTKALLVDLRAAAVVATAAHRTTIETDLMDGYDACVAALRTGHPEVDSAEPLACSSAGGGPRGAAGGPPLHEPGAREMAHVEDGTLTLCIDGERPEPHPGHTVTLDADLPHHFENPGQDDARFYAVVAAGLRRS